MLILLCRLSFLDTFGGPFPGKSSFGLKSALLVPKSLFRKKWLLDQKVHFYEKVDFSHFGLQKAPNSTRIIRGWRMVARRRIFDVDAKNIFDMKMIFDHKNDFCIEFQFLMKFTKNFLPRSRPL